MNKHQLIDWMINNLPEWPLRKSQGMNIPSQQWEWMFLSDIGMYAMNVETGECVFQEMFLESRRDQRLVRCGVTFGELMEDLKS